MREVEAKDIHPGGEHLRQQWIACRAKRGHNLCIRPQKQLPCPFDLMPLYQVIVLAIVQGLTEFLPISSTAHLYLTSWLLGWQTESLTFDIALHIGTLAAVLVYFLRDWVQILAQGL